MSFKDKTFQQRFNDVMWNHSERAFVEAFDGKLYRFGLDQMTDESPIDGWALPPFVRYMPDYIGQLIDRGKPFLIEVQGTGKDRLHKFKLDKLDNMGKWQTHMDVWYWLWDDTLKIGTMISYHQLKLIIAQGKATRDSFDGGKRPYWAIPVNTILEMSDWGTRRGSYMVPL